MSIKSASLPTRRMWASEKFSRRMCIVATGRVAGRMVLKYDGADIIGGLSFFSVFFASLSSLLSHTLSVFFSLVPSRSSGDRSKLPPLPSRARDRPGHVCDDASYRWAWGAAQAVGRRRREQRGGQSWQDKSGNRTKRTTLFFTLPKSTFRKNTVL